jgi:hypothetical protein
MLTFARRCLAGKATLAEAGIGLLFFGGAVLSMLLGAVVLALGGPAEAPTAMFVAVLVQGGYLLFASACVWRCAFNTRYWGVGAGARVLALGYAGGALLVAYLELHAV